MIYKNKAVFLDRDGTINKDVGYLDSPDRLELLPGAIEGLKLLQSNSFLLIIVSNQSGIARGYFSEERLKEINQKLENMLLLHNIKITASYYCPHHFLEGRGKYKLDCNCRKPLLGMIEKAACDHFIDLSKSIVIGDKHSDVQMAEKTNMLPVLVKTGKGAFYQDKVSNIKNIRICENLFEAAKTILEVTQ